MYKLNIEVMMAKAKNHTDNIDYVTLGNIETNFCLRENGFPTDYPISLSTEQYVRQS